MTTSTGIFRILRTIWREREPADTVGGKALRMEHVDRNGNRRTLAQTVLWAAPFKAEDRVGA